MNITSKQVKLYLSRLAIGLGVLAFVGLVGWFTVGKSILAQQEKQRFEDAAESLQQLATDIQSKIGPANEVSEEKSCGYSSAKYSKGNLSCHLEVILFYADLGLSGSNEFMSSVSREFDSEIYGRSGNHLQEKFETTDRAEQFFSQSFTQDDLLCSAVYSFTDKEMPKGQREELRNGFAVNLSCSGSSRSEYYPKNS